MHRLGVVSVLLLCAACDLTEVAPPPVPLSTIRHVEAAANQGPAYVPGPARVRLVRAVSPTALATLHLPDIGGAIARFQKTGLYRVFTSPELRAVLGDDLKLDVSALDITGAAPVDVRRLQRALKGELIIALEKLTIKEGAAPDVRALAGISVAGAERDAEQLVEMLSVMAAAQPGVTVEKGTVSSTAFSRLIGKQPWPWAVEVAVHRDALLVGYGRDSVTGAIARLIEPQALSLAEDEGYRAAMSRCAAPRDALRLTINVAEAWKRYGSYLPKEARAALEALGLDAVRGFATAIRFDGNDIAISSLLDSPGGKDFFSSLLAAHPVDRQFLGRIPATATSFSIFALDGSRLVAKLREVLPAEARREIAAGLQRMRDGGVDLEKDVLEVFGPRCALVGVPTDRPIVSPIDAVLNQLFGSALVVEVQDPDRARRVLERLPAPTGARRRDFVVEGVTAVSYRFEGAEMPEDLSLSYALDGSYLIVAPTEATLRHMLRPRSPDTAKRFRELVKEAPASAAVLSYEDLREGPGVQFEMMLAGFMNGVAMARGRRVAHDDVARLGAKIPVNLGHAVSYTVADDGGIYSFTRSPTGGFGSTGGVFGLAVIAAIAVPNLLSARMDANESMAIASLRSIAAAQESFRSQRYRDGDGDGEGEFGFLGELMGHRRPGEREPRNPRSLIGNGYQRKDGDWTRAGYYFRAYLPAEDGSPIGGDETGATMRQVDGDLAESILVVVAWPVNRNVTGRRAFLLDASGTIHATSDGPYEGRDAPSPDLLSSQKSNLASQPLRRGGATRDGWTWVRLR